MRAVDALEEAIAARIHDRRDIPMPSPVGEVQVLLPTLTAVKVILYQGMRDQNIGKAELARVGPAFGLASAASRSCVECQSLLAA